MKHIIQYNISQGDSHYIAEGVNIPVVTQAKTLDQLIENIKEVTALLLDGEDPSVYGIATPSSVLVNLELPETLYA